MAAVLEQAVTRYSGHSCMDCGKCTAVCPVALSGAPFSPRRSLGRILFSNTAPLSGEYGIWHCLTCRACEEVCPAALSFSDIIAEARKIAFTEGAIPEMAPHGRALYFTAKIMASPALRQRRLEFIPREIKTSPSSEILFWTGCAPLFDPFFTDIESKTQKAVVSSLMVINSLGIIPFLSPDERCCGHDILFTGDEETFESLARLNMETIKRSGASTIITACAECYYMLKVVYPERFGVSGVKILHLSEFIAEHLDILALKTLRRHVTYQDPCRLGRFMGIYDAPRSVLTGIRGLEFTEMEHSKGRALCCGATCFISCNSFTKGHQLKRLGEALKTGADTIVTSCPKCEIHLSCAMRDPDFMETKKIKIEDMATLLLSAV